MRRISPEAACGTPLVNGGSSCSTAELRILCAFDGHGAAEGGRESDRIGAAMGDAHQDLRDPQLLGALAGGADEVHPRRPQAVVAHFHVGPTHALAPARAQAFEDGFLRGPAAGELLGSALPRLAIADLARRVHPLQETLAVLLDHLGDAHAFHDVGADAENLHDTTSPAKVAFRDLSKTAGTLYNPN